MADASKEELIVSKAACEAESYLKGLEKDLQARVKQFPVDDYRNDRAWPEGAIGSKN